MSFLTKTPDRLPREEKWDDDDFARAMELQKENENMERYYEKKNKAGNPC